MFQKLLILHLEKNLSRKGSSKHYIYSKAIYNADVKIIKNNKIKKVLESDLAKYAVKKAQGQLYNCQNV